MIGDWPHIHNLLTAIYYSSKLARPVPQANKSIRQAASQDHSSICLVREPFRCRPDCKANQITQGSGGRIVGQHLLWSFVPRLPASCPNVCVDVFGGRA